MLLWRGRTSEKPDDSYWLVDLGGNKHYLSSDFATTVDFKTLTEVGEGLASPMQPQSAYGCLDWVFAEDQTDASSVVVRNSNVHESLVVRLTHDAHFAISHAISHARTRTFARTHARTHARAHARTHARTLWAAARARRRKCHVVLTRRPASATSYVSHARAPRPP